MKVAFLNCTDELNPDAGSELTCVFLDNEEKVNAKQVSAHFVACFFLMFDIANAAKCIV